MIHTQQIHCCNFQPDNMPLSSYQPISDPKQRLQRYLDAMRTGGAPLDAIKLQACANITGIKITVSTGDGASHSLVPDAKETKREIHLAHVSGAEFVYLRHGKHIGIVDL